LENVARNVYECLFILDSNRYARDPGGVSGTIPQMIEGLGGTILANRLWNEQRLAYPINGHLKGTYWLTYFEFESTRLPELDRACHLNEAVVRQMVLKIDPRLVDAMVAHARGEAVQPAATEGVEGETEVVASGAVASEAE
jgi:small subunit ribosomal protein S6